uniref:Sleeping Beauty transposase HTH domain-containing protein n=1 Tax=Oncorhynchus tshawytscha TaxID=74940 RepID=A0AAZ3S1W7_ONCTS
MIWKGTPVYLKGPTVDSAGQSKNQTMRSKELSLELRDRIVSKHRSGKGYQNISAALKVPKNTEAIILKRKKFGTTKTLPTAGRPAKLINQGRKALVRELERICREEWEKSQNTGVPSL